jgi:hypothetical protein
METFSLKTSYSIRPKTAGHLENPNWQGEWWCYWQRAAYWDYLGKYGLRLDVKNGTIKISYVDPIVTSFNSAVPTRIPRSDHTATKTFLWSKYSSWDIGLETIQKLYPLLAKFLLEWREIYVTPFISQGYHQRNLRSEPYLFPNSDEEVAWHTASAAGGCAGGRLWASYDSWSFFDRIL